MAASPTEGKNVDRDQSGGFEIVYCLQFNSRVVNLETGGESNFLIMSGTSCGEVRGLLSLRALDNKL
jgi:hypothetical protein